MRARAKATASVKFWQGKHSLENYGIREVMTVLSDIKQLEMVIRSVPDTTSLILDRSEQPA